MKILREELVEKRKNIAIAELSTELPKHQIEQLKADAMSVEELSLRLRKLELKFDVLLKFEAEQRRVWERTCLAVIEEKVKTETQCKQHLATLKQYQTAFKIQAKEDFPTS